MAGLEPTCRRQARSAEDRRARTLVQAQPAMPRAWSGPAGRATRTHDEPRRQCDTHSPVVRSTARRYSRRWGYGEPELAGSVPPARWPASLPARPCESVHLHAIGSALAKSVKDSIEHAESLPALKRTVHGAIVRKLLG